LVWQKRKMKNNRAKWIPLTFLLVLCVVPGFFSCNYITAKETGANSPESTNSSNPIVNQPGNNPPVIEAVVPEWRSVARGTTSKIKVIAHDPDGDSLTYTWSCKRGSFSGKGSEITYTAPTGYIDDNLITVVVIDGRGGQDTSYVNSAVTCCSYAQKNPDWSP
jgi:hypothetical protein